MRFMKKLFRLNGYLGGLLKIALLMPLVFLGVFSCNPEFTEPDPSLSFRRIYDKSTTMHYLGIDIKQTTDNGYGILGVVDREPYLLKVDKNGDFLWDTDNGQLVAYRDPVPTLLASVLDGQREAFFFFCLKKTGLEWTPILLRYTRDDQTCTEYSLQFDDNSFFTESVSLLKAVEVNSGIFLLMVVENDGDTLHLLEVNTAGRIIGHLEHTVSNNCFYAYDVEDQRYHHAGRITNSPLFYYQTFMDNDILGAPGKLEEDCFSTGLGLVGGADLNAEYSLNIPFLALTWHVPTNFSVDEAVSNTENGPDSEITMSGARITDDIVYYFVNKKNTELVNEKGEMVAQVNHEKGVYMLTMTKEEKQFVFFASTTRGDTIEILGYDWETGGYTGGMDILAAIKNYETAAFIATSDGGQAVLGNTNVQARMGRICLFKLSEDEVKAMCGL